MLGAVGQHLRHIWACSSTAEHLAYNRKVAGSNPAAPTNYSTHDNSIDNKKEIYMDMEIFKSEEFGTLRTA